MEKSVFSEFDSSTINSRSSSSIQIIDPITEFSVFIEKLTPIIIELKDTIKITEITAIQKAIESLETDYKRAKAEIDSTKLISSPAKRVEDLTQNLGRSLGLVLFAGREFTLPNRIQIEELCKEMMNVKLEWEFEDEIVEEDEILGVDDVMEGIRCDNDEEKFRKALLGLNEMILNGMGSNERINDESVVKVLSGRLGSSKGRERVTIVRILRCLVSRDDRNKENMKELGFLSALVKSLARDVEEQREAVGLLLSLSDDSGVRRRIGRIQGCVVMLVAISNGDDREASRDAKTLLNAMSGNTQHTLYMAEAGYFKPLIKYLKEGSDMSKILMATALSRMELTDQNKSSLGEEGAIEPLYKMFKTGNLEAKLSSLNALQNLSNLHQNIQRLIYSGVISTLIQLLFSVTSVLMTLREPASCILAKVAQSESILDYKDLPQQMLSLLNLSSPIIQSHLLEALNNIASHSSASKVRKKMNENGAIRLLLPFFTELDTKIRSGALKLVYTLSKEAQEELVEETGYANLSIIASIASNSTSEFEKGAALGILSNLPVSDKKITELLKKSNIMSTILSTINSTRSSLTLMFAESIAGILIRFTIPTDKRLQHYSVENGVFPILLKLLSSTSEVAKCRVALCLAQLSQNSLNLSKSRKSKWLCGPHSLEHFCEVHDGYCSVKSTFCLVKAGAIAPLVRILEGDERGSDEAILGCLSTLLQDEIWEKGSDYIVKMSGIRAVIKVLESGGLKSLEKGLWILERIFRVEAHRVQSGESAKVVLIHLAQNGDPTVKPMVAKLLAQLELLQNQSSYF